MCSNQFKVVAWYRCNNKATVLELVHLCTNIAAMHALSERMEGKTRGWEKRGLKGTDKLAIYL
jgi:hypothetical protein